MATLTATIATKLARQGDLAVEVESLKNGVADTQRSLAADQELAAKLAESCSGQSSEWEERQKSRLGEGALCARRRSRKTVTCHCLCVVEPVYIRPCCAADGKTGGGELRGRASLVTLDVFTGHICSLSFCLMCRRSETSTFGVCKAADVQRSGPGSGGRAHEAVQHQTQFPDHVLCLGNTVTSRRWCASSPSRSSPTPASLVKTRSRHLIVALFFWGERDPKRFDVRSWYEAAKDRQECGS